MRTHTLSSLDEALQDDFVNTIVNEVERGGIYNKEIQLILPPESKSASKQAEFGKKLEEAIGRRLDDYGDKSSWSLYRESLSDRGERGKRAVFYTVFGALGASVEYAMKLMKDYDPRVRYLVWGGIALMVAVNEAGAFLQRRSRRNLRMKNLESDENEITINYQEITNDVVNVYSSKPL